MNFVRERLSDVLNGRSVGKAEPPPIDLCCSSVAEVLYLSQHLVFVNSCRLFQAPRDRSVFKGETTMAFVHGGRRNFASERTSNTHTYIPSATHQHIFPLYNPTSFDIVLFWEFVSPSNVLDSIFASTLTSISASPSASQFLADSQYTHHNLRKPRSGHLTLYGTNLGATHAPLQDVIEQFESAKVKRSMYAETQRENVKILEAIRTCEWNVEMNPLDVVVASEDEIVHDFSSG